MTVTAQEQLAITVAQSEVANLRRNQPMLQRPGMFVGNYRGSRFAPARAEVEDVPSGIYYATLNGPESSVSVCFKVGPVTSGELSGTTAIWVTDPAGLRPNFGSRWTPIGTMNNDARMYLWSRYVESLADTDFCKAIMMTIKAFDESLQERGPIRRVHAFDGDMQLTACFRSIESIVTEDSPGQNDSRSEHRPWIDYTFHPRARHGYVIRFMDQDDVAIQSCRMLSDDGNRAGRVTSSVDYLVVQAIGTPLSTGESASISRSIRMYFPSLVNSTIWDPNILEPYAPVAAGPVMSELDPTVVL